MYVTYITYYASSLTLSVISACKYLYIVIHSYVPGTELAIEYTVMNKIDMALSSWTYILVGKTNNR